MEEIIIKKNLFGKEIEIIIYNTDKFLAEETIEETYKEALRLQKIFNFFNKSSELSMLNKKRKLIVSDELLEVLRKSLKFCKLTFGRFDITLGKQIIQRKRGIQITLVKCSYKDIKIMGKEVELSHPDVLIDLGSIAKGYIVDKMIGFMKSKGICSGLIDARGDIFSFGNYSEIIDIQHPRDKNKIVTSIKAKNLGVATSGDYNQYYGAFEKCHIINKKDLISVTIVAPSLEEADLYSTVLFVSGKKGTKKLLDRNKNIKALTIDLNLNINYYNGFEKLIYEEEK
jgi:thiamine biosynthesis lipoprotein